MKGFVRPRTCAVLALLALMAIAGSAGTSALAASNPCTAKSSPRSGHFAGVIRAVPTDLGCVKADDPANGDPPLIWHNGPVMGTTATGRVVVTPIYWHPAGHPMAAGYQSLIS